MNKEVTSEDLDRWAEDRTIIDEARGKARLEESIQSTLERAQDEFWRSQQSFEE